jgi:hypothetical protein
MIVHHHGHRDSDDHGRQMALKIGSLLKALGPGLLAADSPLLSDESSRVCETGARRITSVLSSLLYITRVMP